MSETNGDLDDVPICCLTQGANGSGDFFSNRGPIVIQNRDRIRLGIGVFEPREAADHHHETGWAVFGLIKANHAFQRKVLQQGSNIIKIFFLLPRFAIALSFMAPTSSKEYIEIPSI